MDPDRRAFLDEVIESPDDDAPRLIYADFLEEQGDPRGEFIRVQCELAQTDPLSAEYFDLLDRNDDLLDEHRKDWAAELKQDVRKTVFNRGFIDTITITARRFAKQAEELFRSTPVHWLRFNYVKGAGPQLAAVPELNRIRHMNLRSLKIPKDDLIPLLTSSHLSSLEGLDVSQTEIPFDADIGRAIGNSAFASGLRELKIGGYQIPEDFCQALFRGKFDELRSLTVDDTYGDQTRLTALDRMDAPKINHLAVHKRLTIKEVQGLTSLPLSQLERLNLRLSRIPAEGVRILALSGAFENVRELSLADCQIPMSGMGSLFQGSSLQACEKLELQRAVQWRQDSDVTDFIRMLARHEPLANLRELQLSDLRSTDFRELATSPQFQGLRALNVQRCALRSDDAPAVSASPWRESLRKIRLIASQIGLDAMRGLCANQYPEVVSLDLGSEFDAYGSITEAAIVHLIQSEAFPNLRELSINQLTLTERTLDAITARDYFPKLRRLSFQNNSATQQGVRDVLTSEHLPRLRLLDVSMTRGMNNRPKLEKEFGKRIKT